MKRLVCAVAVAAAVFSSPAAAKPVTDCPLRDAPFSIDAPLIDVLLSPAARTIVENELGGDLTKLPVPAQTTAPSFAAIVSVRDAVRFTGKGADGLDALDKRLRALPVTAADRVARCVRYDNDRPKLTVPKAKRTLLLFEKINGYKDVPSVNAAHAEFFKLAADNGWAVVATDKGGAINPKTLRRFDAVIWNNISGDVLTLGQRKALRSFIENGGGFLGVHGSGGDFAWFWDWYVDTLIGARFIGHPMGPQFQDARVALEVPTGDPLAKGLPRSWTMLDEWYSFAASPRQSGADIVATLDENTYKPTDARGRDLRMGDHPIAWRRCIGKGRSFYSAIGHRPETYSTPEYRGLLRNAMEWVSQPARCTSRR